MCQSRLCCIPRLQARPASAREPFAPALYLAARHPNRVIFVEAGDDTGVLTAMEEALRHEGRVRYRFLMVAAGRREVGRSGIRIPALVADRYSAIGAVLRTLAGSQGPPSRRICPLRA